MTLKLLDGAIGTILLEKGFAPPFEGLNITHPQLIKSIHQSYLDAGSMILLTHTFSATTIEECESAWKIIKDLDVKKFASIGPQANINLAVDFFKDKTRLVFETIYQISSAKDLIERYHQLNPIYSFSLRAADLAEVIPLLIEKNINIIGLNCLNGFKDLLEILEVIPPDFEIYLKPNAGTENISPEAFATTLMDLTKKFNITYLGGCCGTTPLHITALKDQKVPRTFWS